MTMTAARPETCDPRTPRVRWNWLWGAKADLAYNLLPFWLGFVLVGALYWTRGAGAGSDPMWTVSFAGHELNVMTVAFILYGPLVDGPHLWATIARTYTDADEWAARKRLLIASLLAFLVGPFLILLPYVIHAITPIPASMRSLGLVVFGFAFGNYALYHINKQHWGFVALYKRKAGEHCPRTRRIDALFFHTAIWTPYLAFLTSPWENRASTGTWQQLSSLIFSASHALFLTAVGAYVIHQVVSWRRGASLSAPKLLYVGTVVSLYYLTFACDARVAAFWVLITGTGHCAQYHAVVWAYGTKRYAGDGRATKRLPQHIFGNFWLYATLGVTFALITLQGPGANTFKRLGGGLLQESVFARVFPFLDATEGRALAVQLLAAFIAGFRLHHFYVDSKIWRVSKSDTLAKNLSV